MKREQRNEEKIEAILTILEEDNIVNKEWIKAVREIQNHNEGHGVAEAKRNGEGPPE